MTQTTTELKSPGRGAIEELSRTRGEPDWLGESRLAAWERYEALPKPTTRDEGWRRTDISGLDLERLALEPPGLTTELAASDAAVDTISDATARAGLLLFQNGAVQEWILDEQLARRGVLLMSLGEAVSERPELVRPYLGIGPAGPNESKLAALRAALWSSGAFIYLPPGVAVEAPFQIVHWNDTPPAALTHTLIVAEEASDAAVVETYAAPSTRSESLASGAIDVRLKQAARVTYAHLQERDPQSWNFMSMRSQQERDSAMTWLMLSLGGRLTRTELTCEVNGQGAEADVLGLVFGDGRQHFDLQSFQDHLGNDTRSDLVLKVALRERATSNFTGLIRVGKTAVRTSSNQENRNLLLSGEAKADSDPKLEILNSDVTRCGHGATVGPADEEMIFYLMTRGLSQPEAERLIVEGFFEPLLAKVPLEGVRQRLRTSIERKLGK